MSEKAEKLKAVLDELSDEDRVGLREYLDGLAEGELTQKEWEEAWSDEINRRLADFDSGKVKGIPGDEVMRRLREKYG